ncbi:CpaF family protein [Ruminococcus albus]|uniref:Type II secretion system protein E n=1 Tax=Ruminococcus albus (strain ATCC 27210 / DSM 20455 / JCM 14654 / NCDO 2250 / 7) TaxID=697329 RepID=E6UJB3_RUMA7|nr:ATPase, T2SS/T4P/T4SS family [Ruminococcus albus]ADU23759.1 type II secretion system protein E [Ruminococcus albus 7 = DSM 20455]
MSLIEKIINKAEKEKQSLADKIQSESVILDSQQQDTANALIKEISSENFDTITLKGIDNSVNELKDQLHKKIEALDVSYEEKLKLEKNIAANISGLGPLEEFMSDPDITEIMVLRYDHVVIEKNGEKINTDVKFQSELHLVNVIQRIVQPIGRQINLSTPIVDARLSDGSRVNATIPPVSVDGATLTIRKFSNKALTGEDYLKLGTLNQEMLDFLCAAVKGKANIIVSGGTNTGKTTLLNMLSGFIPEEEMVITIEDSCELQLKSPNVRRLEAKDSLATDRVMKIDIKALVKNSLRMNPDRIIVGEIRDGTIVDMISAMSTGHEGSMSTTHANSPANLVNSRIPIFYSMANASFTAETQALQVAEALDLIVQIGFRNKKRVITHITEVSGASDYRINLKDIFTYDSNGGFSATGYVPKTLLSRLKAYGSEIDEKVFDPKKS